MGLLRVMGERLREDRGKRDRSCLPSPQPILRLLPLPVNPTQVTIVTITLHVIDYIIDHVIDCPWARRPEPGCLTQWAAVTGNRPRAVH
jgi:hypothetical protein